MLRDTTKTNQNKAKNKNKQNKQTNKKKKHIYQNTFIYNISFFFFLKKKIEKIFLSVILYCYNYILL